MRIEAQTRLTVGTWPNERAVSAMTWETCINGRVLRRAQA